MKWIGCLLIAAALLCCFAVAAASPPSPGATLSPVLTEPCTSTLTIEGCGTVCVDGWCYEGPVSDIELTDGVFTLEAIPCSGWQFDNWSGDLTGSANPTTITMDACKSVTANFSQAQCTLVLTGVGSGSVLVDGLLHSLPWSGDFPCGSSVALEAVGDDGFHFAGWSGDLDGIANPAVFQMDADKTIGVLFEREFCVLAIAAASGNGSVMVDGVPHALPWQGEFECGTVVCIEVLPDTGWHFVGWECAPIELDDSGCFVIENGPIVICPVFVPDVCCLTVDKTGEGSVIADGTPVVLPWQYCGPEPVIALEAVPDSGFCFAGWSGDVTWPTSVIHLTDPCITVCANFVPCHCTVTLDLVGEGSVTVNGDPVSLPWSGEFDYFDEVALEALPAAGWGFTEWSGDVSSALNPFSFRVQGHTSVTAVFCPAEPVLTILGSGTGGGMVKVDGEPVELPWSKECRRGVGLTVEAVPDECSLFDGWSGDVQGDDETIVVYMDEPKSITASFSSAAIFNDVDCGFWAAREIAACADANIVKGYPDGLYHPELTVTRDQMAVYIARALVSPSGDVAIPDQTPPPSFSDVPPGHWAYKHIEYVVSQNVVMGYSDGDYHPDWEVTRGQIAVFIYRAIFPDEWLCCWWEFCPEPSPFPDVPATYWSSKQIAYLYQHGVVKGYEDGYYRPGSYVTRDQMAVYIARAFGLL